MKIRVYFELCTRNEAGAIDNTFGLAINIGESNKAINYQKLTSSINIEGVLRTVCLDGIVRPEDVRVISPEEYDENYGDGDAV